MKVDLLLAVLAILGIIGYVFLFLGTAEGSVPIVM